MNLAENLVKAYFNWVYNPVYDITTGRLSAYRNWQKRCVGKLLFEEGDSILCVGIGTGNEILYILDGHSKIEVVGVDFSERALRRAYRKGLKRGKKLKVIKMDAQNLQYPAESFNKALCLHVMDFIEDDVKATEEILRVLRRGGQFVITYPSGKEGIGLGFKLFKDSIHHNSNSGNFAKIFPELLVQMGVGVLYVPLLFRAKQRSYSRQDLEAMFAELKPAHFQVEEYPRYNDFIVSGRK